MGTFDFAQGDTSFWSVGEFLTVAQADWTVTVRAGDPCSLGGNEGGAEKNALGD